MPEPTALQKINVEMCPESIPGDSLFLRYGIAERSGADRKRSAWKEE